MPGDRLLVEEPFDDVEGGVGPAAPGRRVDPAGQELVAVLAARQLREGGLAELAME